MFDKNHYRHVNNFTTRKKLPIEYGEHNLLVACHNAVEKWRWDTWLTKEPETIWWIENRLESGMTFVDIGANIGVYSVFTALMQEIKEFPISIVAVEPLKANFHSLLYNLRPWCNNSSAVAYQAMASCGSKGPIQAPDIPGWSDGATGYENTELLNYGTPTQEWVVPSYSIWEILLKSRRLRQPIMLKIDVFPDLAWDALASAWSTYKGAIPDIKSLLVEVSSKEEEANIITLTNELGMDLDHEAMGHPQHSNHRRTKENGNTTKNLIFIKQ